MRTQFSPASSQSLKPTLRQLKISSQSSSEKRSADLVLGLIEAAWTLIRISSGFEICGVGKVATSYSLGLQYFESAIARMVPDILAAIVVMLLSSCLVDGGCVKFSQNLSQVVPVANGSRGAIRPPRRYS